MITLQLRYAIVAASMLAIGARAGYPSDYFTLVPPGKHTSVGLISHPVQTMDGKIAFTMGTGTLIAPNLVLTASHVVSGALAPQDIRFAIILPDGQWWTTSVMAYRTHPRYLQTERLTLDEHKIINNEMLMWEAAAADIAILRLVENAPQQIKDFPELGKLPSQAGDLVEAVGFGDIEGKTEAKPAKRSGQLQFYEKSRQQQAIFRTPPGKLQRTNHGDSGGPLLEIHDDRSSIVAITQGSRRFDKLNGLDPNSYGLYVSIEDNRDWIDRAIKELKEIRLLDMPYFYLKRDLKRDPSQLSLTRQQIAGLLSIQAPADRVINQVFARGMNEPIPMEVLEAWSRKYPDLNPDQYFIHAAFSKKPTPKTIKQPNAPTSDAGAAAQKK